MNYKDVNDWEYINDLLIELEDTIHGEISDRITLARSKFDILKNKHESENLKDHILNTEFIHNIKLKIIVKDFDDDLPPNFDLIVFENWLYSKAIECGVGQWKKYYPLGNDYDYDLVVWFEVFCLKK